MILKVCVQLSANGCAAHATTQVFANMPMLASILAHAATQAIQ